MYFDEARYLNDSPKDMLGFFFFFAGSFESVAVAVAASTDPECFGSALSSTATLR